MGRLRGHQRVALAMLSMTANGCDRSPAPTRPPAPAAAPADVAEPESEPVPGPREAGTDDLDEEAVQPDPPPETGGLPEPVEAYEAAEAAAAEAMGDTSFVMTPALPTAWPVQGGEVEYLVYPLTPVDTGVSQYVLGRAKLRVLLSVADGSTRTEDLVDKAKPLGRMELGRGLTASDPVRKAERSLFQVVAGERTAERAKFTLYGYDKWLDSNGLIGADIRKRKPEFSSFLVSTTQ